MINRSDVFNFAAGFVHASLGRKAEDIINESLENIMETVEGAVNLVKDLFGGPFPKL